MFALSKYFGIFFALCFTQYELAYIIVINNSSLQETHGRTLASLTKTDENLSDSLMKVTALENALTAAGEKFIFMQKLGDYVSVMCDFLQVRIDLIYELALSLSSFLLFIS